MNPNYSQTRFRLKKPVGVLPPRFAIVTACNPMGVVVDATLNEEATEQFRQDLLNRCANFFPVTGGSMDFSHAEPGFGIAMDDSVEAIALGRHWKQEAIFWVENGTVSLISCASGERSQIGHWNTLAEDI